MPPSGSPTSGSYTQPHTHRYLSMPPISVSSFGGGGCHLGGGGVGRKGQQAQQRQRQGGDSFHGVNLFSIWLVWKRTLLLVMEAIDSGSLGWDDMVTASTHAISMGGSQVWLKENEQMTVREKAPSRRVSIQMVVYSRMEGWFKISSRPWGAARSG